MSRLARVFPYLIMLLLLSASPATAQVINLVTDGTMEAQDLAAWRAYGVSTFEKSNSDAYAGSWSMYAQGGFQQTVLTVEAGKTYVLKLQYRRKSGTFRVRVGIGTSNADYQGREFATSTSPDAWTVFERTLEMPAQMAGTFRLVFPLTGQVYVDEVSLRPDNLVNDGDMEAAGTAS
ncbi:MAG: hypothetical protein FJ125_07925, partial [Deltaproteobacteria bacterium]|nr:hypothetical protein [Deltaproteobacteria bacterium]